MRSLHKHELFSVLIWYLQPENRMVDAGATITYCMVVSALLNMVVSTLTLLPEQNVCIRITSYHFVVPGYGFYDDH